MEWEYTIPEWGNDGTEPSEDRKTKGFESGYKPPAGIFNWFWSKVTKAIKEIQAKFGAHAENKENPHEVTAAQLGLDKVNNTPDSEKSVAFASEAGTGRKVEHALTVRFNGGSTEGTDLWTFDGSTSRSINITPEKLGASEEGHTHTLDDVGETSQKKLNRLVNAISTDGIVYTATVDGITELYNGLEITIIPNMTSTSKTPTLNINGLGAIPMRMAIGGYNFGNSGTTAALDGWLGADCPVTFTYKAKFSNWQSVVPRPSTTGLYGTVKVEQGGTGADNADEARENLGASAIFSAPSVVADKKLPKAGYFYIQLKYNGTGDVADALGAKTLSAGAVYWDGASAVSLYTMDDEYRYAVVIGSTGAITIYKYQLWKSTTPNVATGLSYTTATSEFDIYIAQIGG